MPHEDTIQRLARCVSIIAMMQRAVKMQAIADHIGVSSRTIQRDMDFLRELGATFDFNPHLNAWKLSRKFDLWRSLKTVVGRFLPPSTT